jgi:hypothetical protein
VNVAGPQQPPPAQHDDVDVLDGDAGAALPSGVSASAADHQPSLAIFA